MLPRKKVILLPLVLILATLGLVGGCQEIKTLKRELEKKFRDKVGKTKQPFVARDGITVRSCPLYQTANLNSEVLHKLPPETPVHLVDKVGEWYRVRTRDGREGYLDQKVVGGEELIAKTRELKKSIEGLPAQAEGVTKSKANFRLDPGRQYETIEELPTGKKFEMYERVVTARSSPSPSRQNNPKETDTDRGSPTKPRVGSEDPFDESVKKDVWYKVKIDDGRVGYLYTHNMKFTPPEEIAKMVTWMRILAWRTVFTTDDQDWGAKNNYIAACAPIGKDPGCDFTELYFMNWSTKFKQMRSDWKLRRVGGMLPITNFKYEGKPGFSIRQLHPTKRDKLILTSFVYTGGRIRKVSEEEIAAPRRLDAIRLPAIPGTSGTEENSGPEEVGPQPEE
jgi:hypothetical protein